MILYKVEKSTVKNDVIFRENSVREKLTSNSKKFFIHLYKLVFQKSCICRRSFSINYIFIV